MYVYIYIHIYIYIVVIIIAGDASQKGPKKRPSAAGQYPPIIRSMPHYDVICYRNTTTNNNIMNNIHNYTSHTNNSNNKIMGSKEHRTCFSRLPAARAFYRLTAPGRFCLNNFQTTLTLNPEQIYICYTVTKQ